MPTPSMMLDKILNHLSTTVSSSWVSDHLCQRKSAFEQLSCEQESRRAWNNGINKLSLTANNKTARFYPNYISEMKSLYLARAKNGTVVVVQQLKQTLSGFDSNRMWLKRPNGYVFVPFLHLFKPHMATCSAAWIIFSQQSFFFMNSLTPNF